MSMKIGSSLLYSSRSLPENQVCESITVEADNRSAAATLVVDQTHPFFFDHKLDHIPGLLLAEGMYQLAETLSLHCLNSVRHHACRLHIEFERFCLFSSPVRLFAEVARIQNSETTICVRSEQGGQVRNSAEIVFKPVSQKDRAFMSTEGLASDAGPPCPKEMINKLNPNNVMISLPEDKKGTLSAAIRPPSRGNLLGDHAEELYHPLYILEAFMQTQRYLNYQNAEANRNKRMRDILRSVELVLERALPQTERLSLLAARASIKAREHNATVHIRKAAIVSSHVRVGECCIRTLGFERNKVRARSMRNKKCNNVSNLVG